MIVAQFGRDALRLARGGHNRHIPYMEMEVNIDDGERRRRLDALAHALRPLHKLLVDAVQIEYERANGPVGGPLQLFHLLTGDEFFLWLHPLSALMAELDEITEQKEPIDPAVPVALRTAFEELVGDRGRVAAPGSFVARYLDILQAAPEVVMAHARMRRALDRIAPPPEVPPTPDLPPAA
jgi:hypothetical protein